MLTFWVAVEDTTLLNGCLQVQKNGINLPLKEQLKRYLNDDTKLLSLLDIAWPNDSEAIPLEVKAGSLVVFNGAIPHFSEANRSCKSRHAFTLHITSGLSEYDQHNLLQASPLLIA